MPYLYAPQQQQQDHKIYLPIIFSSNIGLLRVNPANPRYFTDGNSRAIYLTGSHTWANFQEAGESNPPPVFDYVAYLDFLQANNHNFFRLWRWEQAKWIRGRLATSGLILCLTSGRGLGQLWMAKQSSI
ncbi:MAG: hypothetical protein HS126_25095 [Anaerolineales bacterium]|nr:hypothetical protein [Anaerolineales bacterium]